VIETRDITTEIAKSLSSGALIKIDGLIDQLNEIFEATQTVENRENEKNAIQGDYEKCLDCKLEMLDCCMSYHH
jgi:hypothetical protein